MPALWLSDFLNAWSQFASWLDRSHESDDIASLASAFWLETSSGNVENTFLLFLYLFGCSSMHVFTTKFLSKPTGEPWQKYITLQDKKAKQKYEMYFHFIAKSLGAGVETLGNRLAGR